ncbi:MAG: transcription-repair coupling factor [Firmicutes bacterium]|nr:transcription-repair coupling factor [Candidatus Fermentithermobacillaceae bacterium]
MSSESLLRAAAGSKAARLVFEALLTGKTPVYITCDERYGRSLLAAVIHREFGRATLLVVPEPEEALEAARDLTALLGEGRVRLFPPRETIPYERAGPDERLWERLATLAILVSSGEGEPPLVVAPVAALMRKLSSPAWFTKGSGAISLGDKLEVTEFVQKLVSAGYERVPMVKSRGQVALRGGIVDFFSPQSSLPVRVEFGFDEVVSIRTFDPSSQLTQAFIESADYIPADEVEKGTVSGDSSLIPEEPRPDRPTDQAEEVSLLDFLPEGGIVMLSGFRRCKEIGLEMERIAQEIATSRLLAGTMRSEEARDYFTWEDLWQRLSSEVEVVFQGIVYPIERLDPGTIVDVGLLSQTKLHGRWTDFISALREMIEQRRKVVVLLSSDERRALIGRRLEEAGMRVAPDSSGGTLEPGNIYLLHGYAQAGVSWPEERLEVFTDAELFPRPRLAPARRGAEARVPLDWRELRPGDYVVHIHHGIGQYVGLKTMTVAGVTREYVHIRYAGDDAIYVPTDQLHLLEKYTSRDGHVPALSRLGSSEWQKTRAKAKQAAEKLAAELLRTQALRKTRSSYQFSEDTVWQKEFEEAFEYEETPDQARAAEEVKRDMEKPVPMDRLLCGDVGYGKTEVAMRAAFKAVQESKQVAVLVPTTILAEQHYTTFTQRFKGYAVNIEVLSRFRSKKEQKSIIEGLRTGSVDIVIGTHRLLSKDVKFRDLGLLIIDEEHRFGVAQKERLKKLKETVHVLTLSATPIPRTLNMALGKLMDISLIETPPEGRFPVETYVIPYSRPILAEAIRREIGRGGQVFYVCHRIGSMEGAVKRIKEMVPEASVTCAHGRMNEDDLARVIRDFLAGRYDVLVSTTIIESGLDFPNVNTLIVENADKLGLAQLYQLRGRVGRRNRIAYAYFTFRPDAHITDKGEERLRALKELQGFGSGLKLAMRDLELRGAGNILGPEQHGFIEAVGFDLYMKLLDKAIAELQGRKEEEKRVILAEVNIPVNAYLPRWYVEDEQQRYMAYKKIAGCESWEDVDRVEREIRDIYGNLPVETTNLLDVARLRVALGSLGITAVNVDEQRKTLLFKIEVPHLFPEDKFANVARDSRGRIRRSKEDVVELFLSDSSPEKALSQALGFARLLLP